MARAPLPGFSKTRLARSLSAAHAAELYRVMLLDTLEGYARLPFASRVLFAPPENDGVAVLRGLAPEGWSVEPQTGPDLGSRLAIAQTRLGGGAVLASSEQHDLDDLRRDLDRDPRVAPRTRAVVEGP